MFEDLIESKPGRERSLAQALGSAAIHFVLILAAIRVTRVAAEVMTQAPLPEVVFLQRTPPPPPPPAPDQPRPVAIAQVKAPPPGFQALVPPKEIPNTIPAMDLSATFNPENYKGLGSPGGTFDGVSTPSGDLGTAISSASYTADQVDDPVQILRQPEPKYPQVLRVAGIRGTVTLEFVVGVDGRAEVASIRVVSSTNERFNDSAIETIRASLFKSARVRGVPVRQLVRQSVNFEIGN